VRTGPAHRAAGEEDDSEVFALVTDLLDVEAYPALALAGPTRCAGQPRR
jgi:hypothetical protein